MSRRWLGLVALLSLVACDGGNAPPGTDAGGDDAAADANVDAYVPTCTLTPSIPTGSTTGHADPLHAGPTEARAGRIQPADLPAFDSDLQVWDRDPAFVLANDRIAIVIEDVGPSDLYDPWGGRILGMARVEGGRLVDPGDFGEFFVLTGRSTVVTRSVTVMNDGSDGQPAVIRAEGMLAPLPFFEAITHGIFPDGFTDIVAAIDYTLAPGSDHVDISMTYANPRAADARVPLILHGFLYTDRMRPFIADHGFDQAGTSTISWLGFADERHTSFVYEIPDQMMNTVINESGFLGRLTPSRRITACGTSTFAHARLTLGSPGADGALFARATERGDAMRAISGVVREPDGAPAVGVRVHAVDAMGNWITRSNITGPGGSYTLHVPAALDVQLDPYRVGNGDAANVPASASTTSVDLTMPPSGFVHVTATDAMGEPLPVRVSVLPTAGDPYVPPGSYGEESIPTGRVGVDYAITGDATIRVPVGSYRVVASRGYEYELGEAMLTVGAHGETSSATLALDRSVDTTGVQCGDFHIHTRRSADSGDDPTMKVRSALADGLEIPVRSDHEYVADFQSIIASMGMTHFAHGICSIEMTSMELWGHMGVFPLVEDPSAINAGAPAWQTYPTPTSMSTPFRTMGPHEVFQMVRARPEAPTIIINHPRGNTNYFGYVGYDDVTGMAGRTADWDVDFSLVEVFNDNNWRANRDGTVADWLSLLDHGRQVFAVGSSDSHGISGSPVGYPRTCIDLGTDDPAMVVPTTVRDRLAAGHATVSGGIYVTTSVGSARSGDTVHVGGSTAMVHVHVEAATWVDVDALDVVVDGHTTDTIMILPGDADPTNPVVRFDQDIMVDVRATGSYAIVAAYGDSPLEPVHRGRIPFGVTNPIFLMP